MGFAAKILKWMIILVAAAVVAVAGWMLIAPPALILVGTGYASKIVCSNVFVAGRDADDVLVNDVQAPGHPVLRLIDIDVDREAETVSAALFGIFGSSTSVHRAGLGCAVATLPPRRPLRSMSTDPRRWGRFGRSATVSSRRRTRRSTPSLTIRS